jgi:aromatic-L-amino-acid/L-tryptophan decarboxylase
VAHPELELVTQELSITTFRYVPADLRGDDSQAARDYVDTLNRALLDALQRGGEVFVSNAVISGRYILRACIVNFHTSLTDVQAVPDIVVRTGQPIDQRMRPQSLR